MGWGPKAPDTSGINAAAVANAAIAGRQQDLAEKEYEAAQARQAKFDPQFEQLIQQAMQSQQTQDARSAEQWDQYKSVFMPAETALAKRSLEYDTTGRRDEAEAAARAGVMQEMAGQQEAQNRSLGRSGISLSSGRALTLDNASRMAASKAATALGQGARNQVEATGLSLLDNTTKTGRGLASIGLQAAGLALNAGQSASGTLGQQQGTYNASLAPTQGFFQGAVGANSSAGSIFGQQAGIQQQANAQSAAGMAGLGSLAGTLLTSPMAGTALGSLFSSKELKDVVGDVDPEAALTSVRETPVKAWRYLGDEQTRVGPMAEDVHNSTGLGDGKTLDIATELGTLRGAVQALADRVDTIKPGKKRSRMSLGDVSDVSYREVA